MKSPNQTIVYLSLLTFIIHTSLFMMLAVGRGSEQNMAGVYTEITHVCSLIFEEAETNSSLMWKPIDNIK